MKLISKTNLANGAQRFLTRCPMFNALCDLRTTLVNFLKRSYTGAGTKDQVNGRHE